jgi:hypothetical protein
MRIITLVIAAFLITQVIGCGDELPPETEEPEAYLETLCNSTGYRVVVFVEGATVYRPPEEEETCASPLRCVSGFGNIPCQ